MNIPNQSKKMPARNHQPAASISYRLIIYMVLCSSVLTLALTIFQLQRDYRADLQQIEQGLEQIEKVHLATISESLWSLDTTKLKTILTGLSNLRDVSYAAVFEKGEVMVSVGDANAIDLDLHTLPLVNDFLGGTLDIGQLEIGVDQNAAYQRLLDRALVILVGNAINTALVAIFMILIFQQVVTRHLKQISSHISSFKLEDTFNPLTLSRKQRPQRDPDELDMVVNSINETSERILKAVAETHSAEGRFRNLFEGVEVSIWDEDLSAVYRALNQLREEGVINLREHLQNNMQVAWELVKMVKVNHVNNATLRLFRVRSELELVGSRSIEKVFGTGSIEVFIDELCAIWRGDRYFQAEANHMTLEGEELTVIISMPIPETEDEFRNIPLSILDITERKKAEQALSYQATHDSLTGLINRGDFERRLVRVLETARASHQEHALCYMDLDQFKVINDTCGHMAGDELLRQLAQLLSGVIRKRDTLARLGGDEFGVLMEHCTIEQASRVAGKILDAVSEFRFVWEEQVFRIGVSIGLVSIDQTSENLANLLSAADSACYMAKDEGRNRIHIYDFDDTDFVRRRGEMEWVGRVSQALEDNRLQLWSQPIVAVDGGGDEGEHYELLLRLCDEQGVIISPGAFLPAAECYGLSTALDRWVVSNAFDWLSRNPNLMRRTHLCCINLSGTSLADEEFLRFVEEQLDQSVVPPQKICFEVTETAAIANLSRAMVFMGSLKLRGCRFALDDFGSGLSSFAYLKTLPVDYLKIDGSFVKDIVDDKVDLALVRSINDVGKVMGKRTIAEFVENDAILEKLREIGVDYAQGYGICRPTPVIDTAAAVIDTAAPDVLTG